jgi:hypothetical protein
VSRFVTATLVALGVATFVFSVSRTTPEPLSPQSQINLGFSAKASLQAVLAEYPTFWAPLYPGVLWVARQGGVSEADCDRALFCVALLLLWATVHSHLQGIRPFYPLLLFTMAHFNYYNIHQHTSENLAVPLSLLLCWLLLRVRTRAGWWSVMAIALTTSALCLTRHFSLFWPFPVAVMCLATLGAVPMRRRAVYTGVVVLISLLPVGLWMLHSYIKTGFLTGMDRQAVRFGHAFTDLYGNQLFFRRTLVIDFFSPTEAATHEAVTFRGAATMTEATLLFVLGMAIMTSIVILARRRTTVQFTASPPQALPWLFALVSTYPVVLITVWTIGNNDPLYTRYLYPWYPFLVLLAFDVYRRTRDSSSSVAIRLPWWLLYVGVLGVQCQRLLGDVLGEA